VTALATQIGLRLELSLREPLAGGALTMVAGVAVRRRLSIKRYANGIPILM
jgi:hypothetical protein